MRVTLVTETYFPQVNGVSRTLGKLVDHLRRSGDRVQLIQPEYAGDESISRDAVAVPAVAMPFYREVLLPLPTFGDVSHALDDFEPDLVHIATEATLGLGVLLHALRRRLPVVSSFHTNFDQYSAHYRVGWASGVIWRYLRWFHNRTQETYVPSKTTIDDLKQRGFERLALWPRGVDGSLFRPDRPGRERLRAAWGAGRDDVIVAYVSRIAPEKNVAYLAEAFAGLARRYGGARFLFVGDGPERQALEERFAGGGRAIFAGYRGGEDLADHYAAADVFAFSSLTETFGNVILEAMASGLPVVALAAGGVADTVKTGKNGIAVDPREPPQTMTAAIEALCRDASQRCELAQGALAHARSQTWEAIMGGLRDRYLGVLEGAGAPATSHAGG